MYACMHECISIYIEGSPDQNGASLLSVLSRKTNLKLWSFGECSLLTPVT